MLENPESIELHTQIYQKKKKKKKTKNKKLNKIKNKITFNLVFLLFNGTLKLCQLYSQFFS